MGSRTKRGERTKRGSTVRMLCPGWFIMVKSVQRSSHESYKSDKNYKGINEGKCSTNSYFKGVIENVYLKCIY